MKFPLLGWTLWLFSLSAMAQTTVPSPHVVARLAPDDQNALDAARAVARLEALWNKTIDWNEKNASLQGIITRVQGELGPDAPSIEMRAPDVNRSTFALTKAPIGTTLVSLAKLANCRVWVFASGIVIAPETALSDEERAAVKAKKGGDWTQSMLVAYSRDSWNGREDAERIAIGIISADLKARLAAKGQSAPLPVAPTDPTTTQRIRTAPFQLPFGELSPGAQKVMQELFAAQIKRTGSYRFPTGAPGFPATPDTRAHPTETTVLPPTTLVCFDDIRPNTSQNFLFLQSDQLNLDSASWYISKPRPNE